MNVIDNFFEKITNLPMLPKVVQEVQRLLNNEEVDFKDLAHKIEHDLVLSAKVLQLCNSSYYGCSHSIKTIDDAISIIGLNNLKTLVVASGVVGAFASASGLDMKRFWRHSLVTASVARQICVERKIEAEAAYLAGIMHSIGQLLIHSVFPVAAANVENMCRGLSVLERKSVEHSMLGIDHCQVGEELAKRWNFPEDIQRALRYYADPLNEKASVLAPIIYMAAHIAFDLEAGKATKKTVATLNPAVAKALCVDGDALLATIETYKNFVTEAESFN